MEQTIQLIYKIVFISKPVTNQMVFYLCNAMLRIKYLWVYTLLQLIHSNGIFREFLLKNLQLPTSIFKFFAVRKLINNKETRLPVEIPEINSHRAKKKEKNYL